MKTLLISGSIRNGSTNKALLDLIATLDKNNDFSHFDIGSLPMFHPDQATATKDESVISFRKQLENNEAVIISTPEYTHNIPAVLKNAFEWVTSSGELYQKKVLPIVFTPSAPRGEKAMQSLIFSLKAMDVKCVAQLILHHTDFIWQKGEVLKEGNGIAILKEGLLLLTKNQSL